MPDTKPTQRRTLLNNLTYIIRNAWHSDKILFLNFFIFTILTAVSPYTGILLPRYLIDELNGAKRLPVLILMIGLFFAVSAVVGFFIAYLEKVNDPRMTRIRFKFKEMFYQKTMAMRYQYIEDPQILNNVETSLRALNDNYNGIEGVINRLFVLFGMIIASIGYVVIIASLNIFILLILLLSVTAVYLLTLRIKKYEYEKKDAVSFFDRKAGYLFNLMSDFAYGKDIRLYHLQKWITGKFTDTQKSRIILQKAIKKKYFNLSLAENVFLLVTEGMIYFYLIMKVINSGLSLGYFVMYFAVVRSFSVNIKLMIESIAHINAQNLYINDFRDFFELENEKEPQYPVKLPENETYCLEFKNVSFRYPGGSQYILKNISLTIDAGQKLAIVGLNGAGKTTFVKLMCRLYDPTEGSILLNGIDIREFSRKEYYRIFSVVFQEIKIFAYPAAENIALTESPLIDRELLVESLKKAGLYEKVFSLPKGLETGLLKILDEEGIELSGGENQKLALARAFYKNGKVIILDEPTAALDPLAEYHLYKNFNDLVGRKTAVFISHRLSSTIFCDVIAFFENGTITEYGTHQNLIEKQGRYSEMFNLQAHYYQENPGENRP